MNLDQMKLTDLDTLATQIGSLIKAGTILTEAGFDPSFAVPPWAPALTVPPIGGALPYPVQLPAGQMAQDKPHDPPRICKDGPRLEQDYSAALERLAQELNDDPAPAIEPTAEVKPSPLDPVALPDASPPASGQEEPAPKQTADAPRLAAGDDPAASETTPHKATEPPTGLISDTLKPAPYTEAETQWAISTFVDMIEGGSLQEAAIKTIALKLNRTPDAIKNRLHTGWKRRVQEEKDTRAKARAKPVAVQVVANAPATTPTPAPAEPARSIYEDPLVQRITTLRMPSQWDYGADRRMLLLAVGGLDAATIAANLEAPQKVVKARLDQLTNSGMHPPAELLRAVTAILAEQKKGVAA